MKIKAELDIYSEDFFYDLFDGGYIDPDNVCVNPEDALRVKRAVETLKDFRAAFEELYGEE